MKIASCFSAIISQIRIKINSWDYDNNQIWFEMNDPLKKLRWIEACENWEISLSGINVVKDLKLFPCQKLKSVFQWI